jgi:DNA modification methylase
MKSTNLKPYYQDESVTIYHGDSREIVPQLGRFDLLLTDPPYGIGIAKNPIRQKHEKMEWDSSAPEWWFLEYISHRASKSVIWGGNYFPLKPAKCFLIWDKKQPQDFSLAMVEQAWTNYDMPAKMFSKRVVGYHKNHPTQKPVELMQWCITLSVENVQTILDPFAGSGTTGRAAKDLGKKATLIEMEESYCEVAAKRMEQECFNFE